MPQNKKSGETPLDLNNYFNFNLLLFSLNIQTFSIH